MAALDDFIDYLRFTRHFSPHTVKAYANDTAEFARFLESLGLAKGDTEPDWSAVARDQVAAYLLSLTKRRLARRTIARRVAALRSLFRYTGGMDAVALAVGLVSDRGSWTKRRKRKYLFSLR